MCVLFVDSEEFINFLKWNIKFIRKLIKDILHKKIITIINLVYTDAFKLSKIYNNFIIKQRR